MASADAQGAAMTTALSGIALPDVHGYTTADLHALPEDGRRWELIDGSLIVVPDADKPTIALAELVLDEPGGQYRFATHYTTDVFTTEVPWAVRIDLPQLTRRRARMLRVDPA